MVSDFSSIPSRIFVTYEDRLELLDGLKLLCLSFIHHCPSERLRVVLPKISKEFCDWVKKYTNNRIDLIQIESSFNGWNVKSDLLVMLLDEGFSEVVWLDADILIADTLNPYINAIDRNFIVVANSRGISDERRSTFWGFHVSRRFEELLNTCFIRVTPVHRELLIIWQQLTSHQEFQKVQNLPFEQRPAYLFGDQDLLEGLLMSDLFACIPVKLLRHGHEVLHTSMVYSIRERISVNNHYTKTGKFPALIHAHGLKPWMLPYRKPSSLNLTDVAVELSPYITATIPYRKLLESDTSWMDSRTWLGYLCALLSWHNPHLQGIPVLLLHRFQMWINKFFSTLSGYILGA